MEAEPKIYQAIMVSSTFTDLEAHRAEVIEAIHRFGFRANVMEHSGARTDADVIDASLQMVRDSAAYLCVIGHKYGQTPVDADRNPKGLSITELEFNEARRLDRPILLFLMADNHPVLPADIEPETKRRKKLQAFRKQAKRVDPTAPAERVYETFASKDEFAKKAAIAVGLQAIRMAGGSDIPDRAIRDAIARFIDVKPDANHAELADAIERFEAGYRALEQQLAAIAVTDNRVTSLKADAEAALAEGDLDKARAAYSEAAEAARDKAAEPVRTAAELKEAEAGAHLLALDWEAADTAWAEAAAMLAPFEPHTAHAIAEDAAEGLVRHGELYARSGAMAAAVCRWRGLAAAAEARGDIREAARLRNNLGNALETLGARTAGPEGLRLLEEAVTSLRDALTVHSRTEMPSAWAGTQNNLGNALAAQGSRSGDAEALRLLNEAVTAFRGALSVYTHADTPADWAMTQNNLGVALKRQGERIRGLDGLQLIEEAATAFRNALTVYTRPDMPADWAMTQNNLGIVLAMQGELTGGPEGLHLLKEAKTAFREALTVYTEADMPADWAMTQNNLANVLATQAERIGGPEAMRLREEAVNAFRCSLTIYTKTDAPADWATTKENLSAVFESMAEADPNCARAHLLSAEAALLEALSVYTPEHAAFYNDAARHSLARVRAKVAGLDT